MYIGEILGLDASAMSYGLKTTMNSDEAVARLVYTCIYQYSRVYNIYVYVCTIFVIFLSYYY